MQILHQTVGRAELKSRFNESHSGVELMFTLESNCAICRICVAIGEISSYNSSCVIPQSFI
jgi:hypothetical protein